MGHCHAHGHVSVLFEHKRTGCRERQRWASNNPATVSEVLGLPASGDEGIKVQGHTFWGSDYDELA